MHERRLTVGPESGVRKNRSGGDGEGPAESPERLRRGLAQTWFAYTLAGPE
jgi:hypothetical protein